MSIIIEEKKINDYPESVSLEGTKEIIKQMEKKVCQIHLGDGAKGSGFFCKIPYPDDNNLLPVLITNNHVINEKILEDNNKIISLSINNENEYRDINLNNRIKYTNKEYDITIIEIKKEDKIENYLDLDKNINNKNNNLYIGKSIYILHYPGNKNIVNVSYGIIKNKNEKNDYSFGHLCCTDKGSSGSPILNIINNRVIGIHKGSKEKINYNIGIFIKYAIIEFNKININIGNSDLINENDISNIKVLEKVKFDNSEKLDLSQKNLSNINMLENVNFKELKELNLSLNFISDIKLFEKVKFEKLKKLNLGGNNISNINILKKMNIIELIEINLNDNKISDLKVLEEVNFIKIEILDLSWNNISNINVLENVKFKELKELNLSHNEISDIKVLENAKFEKLEILDLSYNNISNNIKILKNVNFTELKELNLYHNYISDIKELEKIKFEKLEILYLCWNNIDKNKYSSIIDNLKSRFEIYI